MQNITFCLQSKTISLVQNYLTQSLVTALAQNHKLKHPGDALDGGGNDSGGGGNDSGGGGNDTGGVENAEVATSHEDSEHTDETKSYHEIKNDIQVDISFVEY